MINQNVRPGGYATGPTFEASDEASRLKRTMQALRGVATATELLRMFGAAAVVASMSMYLLQGWHEGNDVSRYGLLLLQTTLLAAAGFAMTYGLRETKGARVFFGLALISVPANFTILGALLYSAVQWDGLLSDYPSFATWQVADVAALLAAGAGALLVLAPVALFAFAVFARQSSRTLTFYFFLLNVLLLLPLRHSLAAGLLAIAGAALAIHAMQKMRREKSALRTAEIRFAMATLLIPSGIILVRSLLLYQVSSLLFALLASAAYFGLRYADALIAKPAGKTLLHTVSLPTALAASFAMGDVLAAWLPSAAIPPVVASMFAGFCAELLQRAENASVRGMSAWLACIGLSFGFVLSAGLYPSPASVLAAAAAGASLFAIGYWSDNRAALSNGPIILAASVMFGWDVVVQLVQISDWLTLLTIGVITIVAASVVDRHGVTLKLRAGRWLTAQRAARAEPPVEAGS